MIFSFKQAWDHIKRLFGGATWASDAVTLSTGTSTVINAGAMARMVSANSHVPMQAVYATGARNAHIEGVTCAKGSLTIHHAAGAAGRVFTYEIRTPAN